MIMKKICIWQVFVMDTAADEMPGHMTKLNSMGHIKAKVYVAQKKCNLFETK